MVFCEAIAVSLNANGEETGFNRVKTITRDLEILTAWYEAARGESPGTGTQIFHVRQHGTEDTGFNKP
ncbi:uncharacterized protein DSM5745_06953 [Aspergillus mulundensis]|uniref:Uncharacterized protein n=1 Tax=Aspergillus mulundensis TaxID=1810919 RepID=A0A3D8RKE0_9EURO|nr:hypothetical protein DSM5745_06953 [Aspergillus mulundensis]RDW74291.1 hypothetical protein DSM5745_06953 [Aspergillus mulundensis]